MHFLPVVERELVAAARRPGTARVRWWTVLVAIVLTAVFMSIGSFFGGGVGEVCFNFQVFYLFGICLLSGVFFTADCLSEEKREGTIGLLFLTDLNGFDVVLGKFAATALASFYGVLALLPIMALPLMLGGVTGTEFWRVALVQLNALFVSLAVGMMVSACSREPQRAMGGTLLVLSVLALGPPLLADLFHGIGVVGWLSPLYSLSLARGSFFGPAQPEFWWALLVSHLSGWALLALASLQLQRKWMEDGTSASGAQRWRLRGWGRRNPLKRTRLLDRNPAEWLLRSRSTLASSLWAAAIALVGGVMLFFSSGNGGQEFLLQSYFKFVGLALKIVAVFQACRFFMEGRRGGALELLLCTPLTQKEIISGHVTAFRQMVLWPSIALASVLLFSFWVQVLTWTWRFDTILLLAVGFYRCVSLIADLAAICWVGMWFSLSLKKPQMAPAVTILVVLIVPSVLCGLDMIVDLVLIAWGRSRMLRDWRQLLIAGTAAPAMLNGTLTRPPVIPPPLPTQ